MDNGDLDVMILYRCFFLAVGACHSRVKKNFPGTVEMLTQPEYISRNAYANSIEIALCLRGMARRAASLTALSVCLLASVDKCLTNIRLQKWEMTLLFYHLHFIMLS